MKTVLQAFFILIFTASVGACKPETSEINHGKKLSSLSFLVVDLDGDGIELVPLEKSNAYFDVDGDGLAEHTAWIKPGDALLGVISREDNLSISDVGERTVNFLTNGKSKFFEKDKNQDGIFNEADKIEVLKTESWPLAVFIWKDVNLNGFPESDEIENNFHSKRLQSFSYQKEGKLTTKDNFQYQVKEIHFEYEDSNVLWQAMCGSLRYGGASLNNESQKLCLKQGYIPQEPPWNLPPGKYKGELPKGQD